MISRPRTSTLAGLVALGAALPFLNGLGNDFLTWDDTIIILGQPFLRELSLENLQHIFSPFPAREEWLPLRDLTLAANFALFGAQPGWFLAGNILLHAAASVAAFFLFLRLCGDRLAAFLGALLFACHCVHVESVTWLSGRKDPLSTLFLILALIAYIRYRDRKAALWPALAAFTLALLSKANGFVFPLWLVTYDFLFRKDIGWKERIVPVIPFGLVSAAHVFLYFRQTSLDGVIEPYPEGGLLTVLLTDTVLLKDYFLAVLLPVSHQAIYQVSFIRTPWDLSFLESLGFLAGIGYLGWRFRKVPWVPFGLVLFCVNLLPYMNFIPHGIYYAERYLYLPSLSFALAAGVLLRQAIERARVRRPAALAVASLVVLLFTVHFALAWSRNTVWADSETFWKYQASVLPGNPAPVMNLGETYEILGDDARAREAYEKVARRGDQVLPEAIYRLARIARRRGDLEKATALYAEHARMAPADPRPLNNMAEILIAEQRPEEAVAIYRILVDRCPRYLLARANLARTLESLGRSDEARGHWTYILEHDEMLPDLEIVREARLRLSVSAPALPSGQ